MDIDMLLEAAYHGECTCGKPLAWTPVNEDGNRYGSCPSPYCIAAYEIVQHVSNGLMEVEV